MILFPVENRKNDEDTLLVSDNSKLEKRIKFHLGGFVLEMRGFEPRASRMRSGRSTTELHPRK